jgi:hypothetical protein
LESKLRQRIARSSVENYAQLLRALLIVDRLLFRQMRLSLYLYGLYIFFIVNNLDIGP